MELTRTPESELASTHPIDNSPIAGKYIKAVSDRFDIFTEAVFLQASRYVYIPHNVKPERVFKSDRADFVDEAILTLYVHSGKSRELSPELIKDELFELFLETISKLGERLEFPRSYLPEELTFYGYDRGGFTREPIPTAPAKLRQNFVMVEYIDRLTLWHLLSTSLDVLNRLPEVESIGAKLYCEFDKMGVPRPLALFHTAPTELEAERTADRLARAILEYLKPRDLRDAVRLESVKPRTAYFASLTDEERFMLARG